MKKLQQGDYVINLTKEQFDELIEIEDSIVKLSYISSFANKSIKFSNGFLIYGISKNQLHFSEFKKRAINTFSK